jgi:hypothetical protein
MPVEDNKEIAFTFSMHHTSLPASSLLSIEGLFTLEAWYRNELVVHSYNTDQQLTKTSSCQIYSQKFWEF